MTYLRHKPSALATAHAMHGRGLLWVTALVHSMQVVKIDETWAYLFFKAHGATEGIRPAEQRPGNTLILHARKVLHVFKHFREINNASTIKSFGMWKLLSSSIALCIYIITV